MTSVNAPILNLSGGILGKHLWGRVDVPSYANSCELMENFRPYAQGVMGRRPATRYIDTFDDVTKKGTMFPFVFNTAQSYVILGTDSKFVFYTQDGRIVTDSVTASISEGGFGTLHPDLADGAGITASSTAAGSLANLVDEDFTTHWQADGTATGYIDFDLTTAYTLYDLWLTSDDTLQARAPEDFTLKGSATGAFSGEETTILTISGGAAWAASETRKYRITTPGSYRYYRLEMTNTSAGTGSYALSEVSLYDSPWLDNSTGNGVMTITGGKAYLDSDGGSLAIMEQLITINETSSDHVLVFDVDHGKLNMRIGSTSGEDDILSATDLRTGHHRITFDPDGNSSVYLQFYHSDNAGRIIDNVSILSGTDYEVPMPYSNTELQELSYKQQGDVLYLCHENYETRRLERRGHQSWSLTYNRVDGGPYGATNLTPTTLSGSDTAGEITLTASADTFESTDAGQLFAMTDSGQLKQETGSALNDATQGINVTGSSGAARTFNIQIITSAFTGEVTLQESSGNENNYVDTATTFTADANQNYDDNKDNQDWFYRLIVSDYTSGSVTMKLTYSGGSSTGVVRIVSVTSATSATAEVIDPLPSTDAITTWKRSAWNVAEGWPSAVTGGYGRLWFGRGITVWASVSDDFTNFLAGEETADSFSFTLTQESSEGIRWLNFLGSLAIGTLVAEELGLGNTQSEPVGPTNFQTVPGSEEGSANIQPVRSEGSIVYVHRSLKKLMQFTRSPQALSQESYTSIDLTELAPELLDDEVVRIAIQREPQRRIFVVLKSGRVGELLFRREIEVTSWNTVKTDGRVEDVCVIQQEDQDKVYFVMRRKINGTWKRFVERYEPENIFTDPELYHLDSALTLDLERPDSIIEASATTGDGVTVLADDAVFSAGDVGKAIWLANGKGTVASYVSTTEITIDITSDLDPDVGTYPIPSGRWGLRTPVTAISGLDHLEGHTVRVFADQQDFGTYTVSSGAITLSIAASIVHVGLAYSSKYRSLKLAYGAQKGTAVGMKKAIKQFTALLYRTGPTMLHGRNFDTMYEIDTRIAGVGSYGDPVPLFTGEKNGIVYDTSQETDPRMHIAVNGPEPATAVGFVPLIETVDV